MGGLHHALSHWRSRPVPTRSSPPSRGASPCHQHPQPISLVALDSARPAPPAAAPALRCRAVPCRAMPQKACPHACASRGRALSTRARGLHRRPILSWRTYGAPAAMPWCPRRPGHARRAPPLSSPPGPIGDRRAHSRPRGSLVRHCDHLDGEAQPALARCLGA